MTYERFRLFTRHQASTETVDKYMMELRRIDPSKVRDAILQGVQNYWNERAAIAITHTNYYEEW